MAKSSNSWSRPLARPLVGLTLGLGVVFVGAPGWAGCDSVHATRQVTPIDEHQKWLDGYQPIDMSDHPPGFDGWTQGAQCAWQLKFFPDVLDGYCGPFIESDEGYCDAFCEAVINSNDD
ncbi:MAG: hypothetical protein FWG16_04775 [Micrococcales bacterium]|nr:hypothetical protein [Micrococcales bacterium]